MHSATLPQPGALPSEWRQAQRGPRLGGAVDIEGAKGEAHEVEVQDEFFNIVTVDVAVQADDAQYMSTWPIKQVETKLEEFHDRVDLKLDFLEDKLSLMIRAAEVVRSADEVKKAEEGRAQAAGKGNANEAKKAQEAARAEVSQAQGSCSSPNSCSSSSNQAQAAGLGQA